MYSGTSRTSDNTKVPDFSFFDLRAANCKYIENSPSKLKFRNTSFSVRKNPLVRWPTTVTAKPKTSRQKQNTSRQNQKPHGKNKIPHGKTENLTAKTKYLSTKPKTSRQNQRPHGKTKYFIVKAKYLTAKANTHGKTKATLFLLWSIWFCREIFGFAVRYFVTACQQMISTPP